MTSGKQAFFAVKIAVNSLYIRGCSLSFLCVWIPLLLVSSCVRVQSEVQRHTASLSLYRTMQHIHTLQAMLANYANLSAHICASGSFVS